MRGPTIITVQPAHPASFGSATELYPVEEDLSDDFFPKADTAIPQQEPTIPRTSFPAYTMYPALETSRVETTNKPTGALPTIALNRPRKLSNSSAVTAASTQSRESSGSGMRSSSWGSRTSFESVESRHRRPDYYCQRPMPIKKPQAIKPKKPNELFATVPAEVLELILEKLKELHLGEESDGCATCWMRDVCSVCLASHKWSQVARTALYGDVQLVGPDSAAHKKKYKLAQGSRALMLRRTLRANPQLAALVRSLKVPVPEPPARGSSSVKGAAELAEYDNLVATLVMACPNLERLSGPTTAYDHSFRKIFHALSTRSHLREMNWLVRASPHQRRQRIPSGTQQLGLVMPGELMPFQEAAFLDHHRNWTKLASLSIHCLPGAALTPEGLLTVTLSSLPSLQHLHLCNLPANSFNDSNLLALPRLRTLTLSHTSGITSSGLSAFATRSTSRSLRRLHLRHTPLTSLAALARMLSHLRSLTTFSLVQAFPPVMPEDDAFTLWMMPYLASSSVKKLHWDITSHKSCVSAADGILAKSIAAGGFPELRTLRALNDAEGIFQNLCHPVERIDLPTDRFRVPEEAAAAAAAATAAAGAVPEPESTSSPLSPTKFLFKTSSSTSLAAPRSPPSPPSHRRPPPNTNLHTARLAAQARLEAAQATKPARFTVNVIEEDGRLVETFKLGAFIGTAGSPIKYHLHPDPGSTDEKGGLVDVRDLLSSDADGESLAGGREGCTGRWNRREGDVADRKEKERWWHTERGRWTRLEL